jgi:hypothetical protein
VKLAAVAKGDLPSLEQLIADLDLAIAARNDAKELDGASQAVVALMGPAFDGARTPASVFTRAEDARRWADAVAALVRTAREHNLAGVDPKMPVPAIDAETASACAAALESALATLGAAADAATSLLALQPKAAFGGDDPARTPRNVVGFASAARAALGTLRDKTASEAAAKVASDLGLGAFIEYIREGRVPEQGIADWYEGGLPSTLDRRHGRRPSRAGAVPWPPEHDRLVEAFRREDAILLEAGKKKARYDVLSRRPPRVTTRTPKATSASCAASTRRSGAYPRASTSEGTRTSRSETQDHAS